MPPYRGTSQLLAQMRVHAAVVERTALAQHVVQATAASHAAVDLVGAPLAYLARERWVGDDVAKPRDDVGLTLLQDALHDVGVRFAVGRGHRLAYLGLYGLRYEGPMSVPYILRGQGHRRLVPADHEVVQVAPGRVQHLGEDEGILHVPHAALHVLHGRPAHEHRVVLAASLLHVADALKGKPRPVLQRPAVLVGAVVGGQRKEAVQDAAHARHDLHAVEARLLAELRAVLQLGAQDTGCPPRSWWCREARATT